jgi:hypothetical protein
MIYEAMVDLFLEGNTAIDYIVVGEALKRK